MIEITKTPSSVISWMSLPRPLLFSCPSACTAWAAPLPGARLWRRPAWIHGVDCDKLLALVNEEANKKAE